MCVPSAMTMKLASSPGRNSSITTSLAGGAELAGEHRLRARRAPPRSTVGDHDALAGGESARLDDDRRALARAHRPDRKLARVKVAVARGRNAVPRRNSLLKALEPSSCAAAAASARSTASPAAAKASRRRRPAALRDRRWSDRRARASASSTSPRCPRRRRRRCARLRLGRGAGIARRHQHFGDARGRRRTSRRARARGRRRRRSDQDIAHQCRKCRMPVNTIAMSCSSAAAMTSASRLEPPGWITARMP